ncbi:MAG: hypothetical protein ACYDDF_03430 [Thermoplasmatota archaeon]
MTLATLSRGLAGIGFVGCRRYKGDTWSAAVMYRAIAFANASSEIRMV